MSALLIFYQLHFKTSNPKKLLWNLRHHSLIVLILVQKDVRVVHCTWLISTGKTNRFHSTSWLLFVGDKNIKLYSVYGYRMRYFRTRRPVTQVDSSWWWLESSRVSVEGWKSSKRHRKLKKKKCCITCRNLQLIIWMNRATVWSLQKMECDSCDIYFFRGGEGGQSQPLRLSVSSFTSKLPKRIKAVKNVEQTIQFL